MAQITEDYVSFETAKLLKEKGFDEPIEMLIREDGTRYHADTNSVSRKRHIMLRNSEINVYSTDIGCPTFQMAMKWLRKEHYCHIIIDYTFTADANLSEEYVSYCYKVENAKTYIQHTQDEWYNTFEQACEAAIKYCLENLI